MKILVVAPDCPYPPNHGGRKDVFTRIELFHRLGHQVDLVFTSYVQPTAAAMEVLRGLCRNVIWVPRMKLPLFVPLLQSFQVRSRARLADLRLPDSYDSVLLESEYVFAILRNRSLQANKVGLRVHNNEASYYLALAAAADKVVKKLYYWSEAFYFRWARDAVFSKVHALYFISHDEYEAVSSTKKHFMPTYVDPARFCAQKLGTSVVFAGNLFTQNNLSGLKWYLDEVHPLLSGNPGYRLVIAGNTKGTVPSFLDNIEQRDSRIAFFDSPEDLDPVYEEGAVFINPMLTGAGVKIKTVDAVVNGLPVVSTSVGAEGIGLHNGDSVIIADDAAGFARGVERLLVDKTEAARIFNNARRFLADNYASADRIASLV